MDTVLQEITFLIGNKKEEDFELLIDSIYPKIKPLTAYKKVAQGSTFCTCKI